MPDGQKEPVAPFPSRVVRAKAKCAEIGHGQHIGHPERLADIALPLHRRHPQGMLSDAPCPLAKIGQHGFAVRRLGWVQLGTAFRQT